MQKRIADTLSLSGYRDVIEIGPGTGVLTKYLVTRDMDLIAMDIDSESIAYLKGPFASEQSQASTAKGRLQIMEADFLDFDLKAHYNDRPFAVTGNFPYNISSQIVFKVLALRDQIPEFSGMFQKEVAKRICESPGSKTYGILSVLVQAFYTAEYLFTVHPQVFDPPPKVQSGVLRLTRNTQTILPCDETLFFKVVKMAFNQRRKTLRNSLKTLDLSPNLREDTIFDQRPEQLAVADFITLTQKIAHDAV